MDSRWFRMSGIWIPACYPHAMPCSKLLVIAAHTFKPCHSLQNQCSNQPFIPHILTFFLVFSFYLAIVVLSRSSLYGHEEPHQYRYSDRHLTIQQNFIKLVPTRVLVFSSLMQKWLILPTCQIETRCNHREICQKSI